MSLSLGKCMLVNAADHSAKLPASDAGVAAENGPALVRLLSPGTGPAQISPEVEIVEQLSEHLRTSLESRTYVAITWKMHASVGGRLTNPSLYKEVRVEFLRKVLPHISAHRTAIEQQPTTLNSPCKTALHAPRTEGEEQDALRREFSLSGRISILTILTPKSRFARITEKKAVLATSRRCGLTTLISFLEKRARAGAADFAM